MTNPTHAPDADVVARMSDIDARDILIDHNRWRRGDDTAQRGDPARVGRAIDTAITALSTIAHQSAELERMRERVKVLEGALRGILPLAENDHCGGPDTGALLEAARAALNPVQKGEG